MSNLEKIGTVEILLVRSHARRYYLPLDKDLVDAYGLKIGDRLRVKIEGRIKEAGGEETG
ncbi:hypothetical protein ES707_18743 [subsurface metagenome]